MLVANTLLVNPHAGNSQNTIFLFQPARVELVVRDDP
jgi:hypothetical protein